MVRENVSNSSDRKQMRDLILRHFPFLGKADLTRYVTGCKLNHNLLYSIGMLKTRLQQWPTPTPSPPWWKWGLQSAMGACSASWARQTRTWAPLRRTRTRAQRMRFKKYKKRKTRQSSRQITMARVKRRHAKKRL